MNKKYHWILAGICLVAATVFLLDWLHLIPGRVYTAEDFGITPAVSGMDFNQNGVDDYADLLAGAKADAANRPTYNDAYYDGGYPPENIGVCTDVVWRAFRAAGYCLRDMVDRDVADHPEDYPHITNRDKNIDFRRVRTLRVYLDRYALRLTDDTNEISQWQAGDIVIFGNNQHIGIVSNRRNQRGQPYVLHNGGQWNREEDILSDSNVTGHYRFDATAIAADLLIPMENNGTN